MRLSALPEDVETQMWEEIPQRPRPHSRLYDLEPMGVGSPLVESLTSYVTRLAEAHSVAPLTLVTREILPAAAPPHVPVNGRWGYNQLTSIFQASAALNGVAGATQNWVRALEQLTGRSDLRFLTLLTFAQVLPVQALLRRRRAWCPLCYNRWREANLVVYEPLLWQLICVRVCGHHQLPLRESCSNPHCRATLLPLEPKMQQGYCPKCQWWMGHGKLGREREEPLAEQAWQWQLWIEKTMGELLASSPRLPVPPARSRIVAQLTAYLERDLDGKKMELARRLSRTPTSIRDWLAGKQLPHLGNLLRICLLFETTPLRFLTEPVEERIKPASLRDLRGIGEERTRRKTRRFDVARIRLVLEEAMLEEPAPPMCQVAKRLGYGASQVYKHLPEQCRAISRRYGASRVSKQQIRLQRDREELCQAMRALHEQGIYPGQTRLQKILSKPGFFRDARMRAAWEEVLQELGWKL